MAKKNYERVPFDDIVSGLIDNSRHLCEIWLRGGKENKEEGSWRCGDIYGSPPRANGNGGSFAFYLRGKYAGKGKDWALDPNGRMLSWLDIIAANIVPDDLRDDPMTAAVKWAIGYLGLGGQDWGNVKRREAPEVSAEEKAAREAARAAEEAEVLRWCRVIWERGIDFDNRGRGLLNPVEKYLRGRGITMGLTKGLLRVNPRCAYRNHKGEVLGHWPAMLAPVVDVRGEMIGLHRTWVLDDGSDKAPVPKPKKMLGRVAGGSVLLVDPEDVRGVLGIAEGIETALSAMQMYGLPMCAALSAGGMMELELAPHVSDPVLFPDNDPPQIDKRTGRKIHVGLNAARFAFDKYGEEGRRPTIIDVTDPGCADQNDVLRKELGITSVAQKPLAATG